MQDDAGVGEDRDEGRGIVSADEQGKKGTKRRMGRRMMFRGSTQSAAVAPIVWHPGATIRGYDTISAFSHAAGAVRSAANAADDYALASPSPDN